MTSFRWQEAPCHCSGGKILMNLKSDEFSLKRPNVREEYLDGWVTALQFNLVVACVCWCVQHSQLSHLPLGESQRQRQLALPPQGDVVVVLELLLQLQPLLVSVHHPVLVFGASLAPWFTQDDGRLRMQVWKWDTVRGVTYKTQLLLSTDLTLVFFFLSGGLISK